MSHYYKVICTAFSCAMILASAQGLAAQDTIQNDPTAYFRFETRLNGVDPLPDGTMGDLLVEYFANADGVVTNLNVTSILPDGVNTDPQLASAMIQHASCPCIPRGAPGGFCIKFCGTTTGGFQSPPLLVRVNPVSRGIGNLDFTVSVENILSNETVSEPIQGITVNNGIANRKAVE